MAIASIVKPFTGGAYKLRLPRLGRSKATATVSTPPASNGSGEVGSSKTDEFQQVFRFLDANGDGKISPDEMMAYFASVGDSVSYEEAKRIIGEFSEGGGGSDGEDSLLLGFCEFVRVMELQETEDDRVVLRRVFEVYEVEKGSGRITPEGIRRVFQRLGKMKSIRECEVMIRVYDLDGNGVLDFDEFYKMMT